MDTIRFAHELPWFTCYAAVFELNDLTPVEKLVYIYLVRCAGSNQRGWPSYARIAHACGCTRRAAINAINSLIAKNLLEKEHRLASKGGHASNIYTIKAPSGGGERSSPGVVNQVHQGGERSSPHGKNNSEKGSGGIRAREDTCSMGSRVDSPGGDSNQDEDALAHPPRPVVAEAQAVLQQLSGVELPSRVMDKITTHDDDQIRRALQVTRAYASRKQINDVVGFFLTALAEGWNVGPPAGPTGDKPRHGSAKETPRGRARDKPGKYNDLYV